MSDQTTTVVDFDDLRFDEIATTAHRQIIGDFTAESDAITALHLIRALALRMLEICDD